jgi:hypothetical protein
MACFNFTWPGRTAHASARSSLMGGPRIRFSQ